LDEMLMALFFVQLTYLLQNSLSGNSKTLVSRAFLSLIRIERGTVEADTSEQMFLNLSPLAAHLNESLCSLRFATKASIQKILVECSADALRGTGQQYTNRNRKEASQEYFVSLLASKTCLVLFRRRLSVAFTTFASCACLSPICNL